MYLDENGLMKGYGHKCDRALNVKLLFTWTSKSKVNKIWQVFSDLEVKNNVFDLKSLWWARFNNEQRWILWVSKRVKSWKWKLRFGGSFCGRNELKGGKNGIKTNIGLLDTHFYIYGSSLHDRKTMRAENASFHTLLVCTCKV